MFDPKPKILLLNPPYPSLIIRDNYCCFTSKGNYLWPPIDLLILSGILNQHSQLSAIDSIAERLSVNQVIKKIENISPNFIISLVGSVSLNHDIQFLKLLYKKLSTKPKLIVMGNIPAFYPKRTFHLITEATAILHNYTSNEIVDFIHQKKKRYHHISLRQKLTKKNHYGHINYKKRFISYPPPRHELFPLTQYSTPFMIQSPLSSVITAFGCPFSCNFCVASSLKFTQRPIPNVIQELNYLKKINVKEIFFEDSTFNINQGYLEKLLKIMIKKNYQFSFSANLHTFSFNESLAMLLKKAGCHTLQIGIENASNKILSEQSKCTNINKIRKFVEIAHSHQLHTLGYFIIGLPDETKQSMQNTINFAKKLNPTYASFSIATADPGTKLKKNLKQKHQIISELKNYDSSQKSNIYIDSKFKQLTQKMFKMAYRQFYLRPTKIFQIIKISLANKQLKRLIKEFLQVCLKMILKHHRKNT